MEQDIKLFVQKCDKCQRFAFSCVAMAVYEIRDGYSWTFALGDQQVNFFLIMTDYFS